MLNEQWGFVRKVLCDPKKQPALPVSTLRPGSYTLIQARIIIQSGVMMIIVWRLWWKINLLRLANAIIETIWCEEWSAMAPVELRCFLFTFVLITLSSSSLFPASSAQSSFNRGTEVLFVAQFSLFLPPRCFLLYFCPYHCHYHHCFHCFHIIVTLMTKCEGFTSGHPAKT